MKILFVCNCNLNRSPTCEKWMKENFPEHEVKSSGIHHGYPEVLNRELINWADIIFVMDLIQHEFIKRKFGKKHKLHIMGISDQYDPDEPALIDIIEYYFYYFLKWKQK